MDSIWLSWQDYVPHISLLLGLLALYPLSYLARYWRMRRWRMIAFFMFLMLLPVYVEAIAAIGALFDVPALVTLSFMHNDLARLLWVLIVSLGVIFAVLGFADLDDHLDQVIRQKENLESAEAEIRAFNETLQAEVDDKTAELRDALEELKQLDRMKDEFIAVTTHELKTPLATILGLSSFMVEQKDLSDKQRENLAIILHDARRLRSLVGRILTASKLGAGELSFSIESVDLTALIDDVLVTFKETSREKGVPLKTDISLQLPPVAADADRLKEVLENLLDNAFKFTEEGTVTVGARREDDHVHVWIADTGVGIAPAQREKIFGRFYQVDISETRAYSGVGLGLSICQGIIESMGGRIWVESEGVGYGTTFHFTLPVMQHT